MRCLQREHIIFQRAGADTARRASDTPVAANVTFRQNSGSGTEAFVAAANNMAQLMQDKGEDPVRTLSVRETGLRTARVIRTSVQVSGATGITQGPAAARFAQQIDGDTVVMRHAPARPTLRLD